MSEVHSCFDHAQLRTLHSTDAKHEQSAARDPRRGSVHSPRTELIGHHRHRHRIGDPGLHHARGRHRAGFRREISSSAPDLAGAARLAAETPRQIANTHTVFNIANTLIFIWFTGTIATLVQKLVPEKPEKVPERAQPIYLDEVYFEAPALAFDRVRLELVRLGEGVIEMLDKAVTAVSKGSREDFREIVSMHDDSSRLYASMIAYMAKLSQLELSALQTTQLSNLSAATNTIDNMGDTIAAT